MALASLAPLLLCLGVARAAGDTPAAAETPAATVPPPAKTRIVRAPGRLVPIPAAIPHAAGDMVDSRIVPDLRWLSQRFPFYVTDGYSGPGPDGARVGCDQCHVHGSDHYNGLAVDLVPLESGPACDRRWSPLTRLAQWAEPVRDQPLPPFRWVGYDGDAGHGCGNHLHLSWNHAPAAQFALAEWVEVLAAGRARNAGRRAARAPRKPSRPARRRGAAGGVAQQRTGGVASGSGDSPAGGGATAGSGAPASGGASSGGGAS